MIAGATQPLAGELARFLGALFPQGATGMIEVRLVPSGKQLFVPVAQPEQLGPIVATHANVRDVYVGVATRRDSSSGGLANCAELWTVFVDIDFKDLDEASARRRLDTFRIRPHVIVHSGNGFHVYWRLCQPFRLRDEGVQAKALLRRLARHLHGDLLSAEPAHILRPPTTTNHKYPRPVVLEHADDGSITASELAECLPPEPSDTNGSPRIAFSVPSHILHGARNNTLYRSARSMHAKGFSAVAVLAALRAENTQKCDPPLGDNEVERLALHAATQLHRSDFAAKYACTDSGNAEAFADLFGARVRYDHDRRQWFFFNGNHFQPNVTAEVDRLALEAIRQCQAAALQITDESERKAVLRWSIASESRNRRDNLMTCASKIDRIAVDGRHWDTNPLLFAVKNGVVDLQTGKFRDGTPSDGITKVAPVGYDPSATCPRWLRFMKEVFVDQPEMVDYMQRVFGYCLTGLTTEQVFWILYGLGGNGKSTFVETLLPHVFGLAADFARFPPVIRCGLS